MLAVYVLVSGVLAAGGDAGHAKHKGTPNRLVDSASPYLLQHAYNPVQWYPWGPEAFERAVAEDKPVFLSIGYAACHWCHVMERESFENPEIAKILNAHFINIKVDREERPDVDEVYMAATQAMTGRGGWPMSVFMTPDRKPFECGTYFPPTDRGNRRGFMGLTQEIANRWQTDRDKLLREAGSLVQRVAQRKRHIRGTTLVNRQTITRQVQRMASGFDPQLGGRRSGRNKFPPSMVMELMLREFATNPEISQPELIETVELTLEHMARGGIYDHIGGGICRYSTDPRWFAPHFEKMLYDQARVAGVYLSAYQLTGNPLYAEVAGDILDYCLTDLLHPQGGFYSSRDADSEGVEGKFYTWTYEELERLLGPEEFGLFAAYYNVIERGNWHHGVNILHVTTDDFSFAEAHGMSPETWRKKRSELRRKVFEQRKSRVHPGLDDKILVEWNGMLINQLARAARVLGEPRFADAAVKSAEFILSEMVNDGRLYRAHRQGTTHIPGYAADYANFIEALITLYETTFDSRWISAAERLNEKFIELFHDTANGGFFYTAHDAESLIVRSKHLRDGVVPSPNSTAVLNLQRLAIHLRAPRLKQLAEDTLRALARNITGSGMARLQWAALFYLQPAKEIALVGNPGAEDTQRLIDTVYGSYVPNKVVALVTPDRVGHDDLPALLQKKTLLKGRPAAYVCQNYVCRKPVSDPTQLAMQLFDGLP